MSFYRKVTEIVDLGKDKIPESRKNSLISEVHYTALIVYSGVLGMWATRKLFLSDCYGTCNTKPQICDNSRLGVSNTLACARSYGANEVLCRSGNYDSNFVCAIDVKSQIDGGYYLNVRMISE